MAKARVPRRIAFHVPSVGQDEVNAVTNVLKSGWLTTGAKTAEFEHEFAEYIGTQFAVAVNSCTAGLHLSLVALGIGPGDEVITTPYTFAATGETIIHAGARPVLVDIEEDGFNIDPAKIAAAITPRTKAIIPVHIGGDPCNMSEIMRLAHRHGIWVVEDAAHALGSSYFGRRIGSISTLSVFSFYATKNLTTAEGGMVTTDFEHVSQRIRQLSLHGLSKDAWNRYSSRGHWRYDICELGYKYNLSDIQSALGLAQLHKFDKLQEERRNLVKAYRQGLGDIPGLILPQERPNTRHAWHLYIIRLQKDLDAISRDGLIEQLQKRGIGVSVHFIPLHLHSYYQRTFGYKQGDFPHAEAQFSASISLPLYPDLTLDSVAYICRTLRKLLTKRRSSFVPEMERFV